MKYIRSNKIPVPLLSIGNVHEIDYSRDDMRDFCPADYLTFLVFLHSVVRLRMVDNIVTISRSHLLRVAGS